MKIALYILTAIVATLLSGFALTKLWMWFIVPVFHLPVLTVGYAIGLSMVVTYLTHQFTNDAEGKTLELAVYAIVKPLMALLIGWIITLFL